jgi:hypothetical protein
MEVGDEIGGAPEIRFDEEMEDQNVVIIGADSRSPH